MPARNILPITKNEMEIRYLRDKNSDVEIARETGFTVKQIRSHRHYLGVDTIPRWSRNDVPPIEGHLQSLLVGSMLGDGQIRIQKNVGYYSEVHYEPQLEYMDWKSEMWGEAWVSKVVTVPSEYHTRIHGTTKMQRTMRTVSHMELVPWFDRFYTTREKGTRKARNTKKIHFPVAEYMDPFAFAIWYMDDGCAGHTPGFTCGYNNDPLSKKHALEVFDKFGFSPRVVATTDTVLQIHIEVREVDKFCDLVFPHIPDCMGYKKDLGALGAKSRLIRYRKNSYPNMLEDLANGVSYAEIATNYGIPRDGVYRYIRRAKEAAGLIPKNL